MYRQIIVLLASCILLTSFNSNEFVNAQSQRECRSEIFQASKLPLEAGELLYIAYNNNIPDPNPTGVRSALDAFNPQFSNVTGWEISPNGMYLAGTRSPDPESNVREVVVFDRSGQLVYTGASAPGGGRTFWLGNDQLVRFVYTPTSRDPRLRTYFRLTYFIIDPFAATYTSFHPAYGRNNDPFFYFGNDPIMDFILTYDGRYILVPMRGAFDFVEQERIELSNFVRNIPSTTSYRFLVVDYSQYNYLDPIEEQTHPVAVYDFDTDAASQISTMTVERPVNIHNNSWSPNEQMWAYDLNYRSEITFRQIYIHLLNSGESVSTCLGRYYETRLLPRFDANRTPIPDSGDPYASDIVPPDFAWSRDSRYLAVQGVLEGQDMDESLGVYVYDTQTGDIYEVYRGRADIVGWMANPNE